MKKLIFFSIFALILTSCGTVEEPLVDDVQPDLYFGPQYQADLDHVDGGDALGTAIANVTLSDGSYTLVASFVDLPELEEGYFYEGWLVRLTDDLSVISTGAVENDMNFYTSEIDLSDHTQYILTLEPDDGDPAPAGHVLEGTFELIN